MSMTDRELLELAARAAGYDTLGSWDEKCKCLMDYEGWSFDPLNDDGDALRLAVKLGMNVHVICNDGTFASRYENEPVIAEKRGDDPCAATRRAIVRLAAEIGRIMT